MDPARADAAVEERFAAALGPAPRQDRFPGEVDHGIACRQRDAQPRIAFPSVDELNLRAQKSLRLGGRTHPRADLVAVAPEPEGQGAAEEAGSARDEDSHPQDLDDLDGSSIDRPSKSFKLSPMSGYARYGATTNGSFPEQPPRTRR